MKSGFAWNRFPIFCGSLVGGYYIFASTFCAAVTAISYRYGRQGLHRQGVTWQRIVRPLAAFCSAWISLGIFNAKGRRSQESEHQLENPFENSIQERSGARATGNYGRSIDLTLFTAVRAVDALVQVMQINRKPPKRRPQPMSLVTLRLNLAIDPAVFASSAAVIMWAWFYNPTSLPKTYRTWIGKVAQVDPRLVQVLRDAREGRFVYGYDNGQSKALEGMCEDYQWPVEWADPSKTIPVPCRMVHMGAGPSCHRHAAVRFVKTFVFAIKMYLPVQLLLKSRRPSLKASRKVLEESIRSSIFLSTFVASFYYGVCLSRTLAGPAIGGLFRISPIFWDAGACVATGSILCGWSVLVEDRKRRQEMAMFVLPRALATFFPRQYDRKVRQAYLLAS